MTAVVLALCCMPVSVCGRTPGDGPAVESRLAFRRYTTQDGLPQMLTERIFQDRRGYIYVGTLSGFVRFDGREFTPFLRGHRWNVVGFMETARGVSALSFRQQWLVSGDEVRLRPLDAEGRWLLNNLNATDLPDGYLLFEDEQEQHRWVGRGGLGEGCAHSAGEGLQLSPQRWRAQGFRCRWHLPRGGRQPDVGDCLQRLVSRLRVHCALGWGRTAAHCRQPQYLWL